LAVKANRQYVYPSCFCGSTTIVDTLACSFGFVNFKNLSDAVRAKREMEGKPLATSIRLSIQFTKVLSNHNIFFTGHSTMCRWSVVAATMVDLSGV